MENEFVSYEQAVALKELGFDEKCLTSYSNEEDLKSIWCVNHAIILHEDLFKDTDDILWGRNSTNGSGYVTAPLKQQVFRWFREKYGIYVSIYAKSALDNYWDSYLVKIGVHKDTHICTTKTYEEAENACIDKLISICLE